MNKKKEKLISFISLIDNDNNLKNWILRYIVLNRIHLIFPDGSHINYGEIKNYVEYKEFKDKLKPENFRLNYYIISSLLFELDNVDKKIEKNTNELLKNIFVKTITIDERINLTKMLQNIKVHLDLIDFDDLKELHIYFIINEKIIDKGNGYVMNDSIINCKNKSIHVHVMSSVYFFQSKFLKSFYDKLTKNLDKKYSVLFDRDIYRKESNTRMNIFIFQGLEWGIIKLYFKYLGYNLNSGVTSLRYKENLVGYRLSKFVSWTGLESKINFNKNSYFDRYIDETEFIDELIDNYKSKITKPDLDLPNHFLQLLFKKIKKLRFDNLCEILLINNSISNIQNDILKLENIKNILFEDKGVFNLDSFKYLQYLKDNDITVRKVNNSTYEINNYENLILKIDQELNLKNGELIDLFKNKIKKIIAVYNIHNWRQILKLEDHEIVRLNDRQFMYPGLFNDVVNEVIEFYPLLVDYIKSLNFKGKINTKSNKKIKSEKRHLHTLINYFDKSSSMDKIQVLQSQCFYNYSPLLSKNINKNLNLQNKSIIIPKNNKKNMNIKWPNIKFFLVIGVLGFGVGIGNSWAGYNNRSTAQELVNHIKRMSTEQGNEVAEKYASSLYRILYQNNYNNQHFQYLIRNVEQIKQNNELINSYQSVLNSSGLDASTRSSYEASVITLQQANQTIISQITNNQEMMQKLNESIAIDNSVILQEIENLRRGWGNNNQFISSIDQLWKDFNGWVQTLDYIHSVAFVNIMGLWLILLSLLQIIFIFYGTVILDYLKLETRYPKLAKFIQLRRTFQQFYLFLNIGIIAIVSIIMLFFNLTFFF